MQEEPKPPQGKMSRRAFIRTTVAAGVGITAFPMIFIPKAKAQWAPKTLVHPNIDPLHVAGITDLAMTSASEQMAQTWDEQEKLVNAKAVHENLDRLACALAHTDKPEEAWRAIFVKPPSKAWSDTVVAIKTNCLGKQHTRSAVMGGVCHVLTDILGVAPYNIHIYDASHGHAMSATPFKGLPEGVKLESTWGGSRNATAVPAPWTGGRAECLAELVYGTVDILINIAMCKGHRTQFGNFTMTMKNHFGTFTPSPAHRGSQSSRLDYLLAINKTTEILGKMDDQTGKVLYPRQQLCLVDALWASEDGPGDPPSRQPNFMAMGVFSPVLDYVMATDFRGRKMGWAPTMASTSRFLSDFGYAPEDLPNGGRILEI